MEDALISPLGLAILSGAGLLDNDDAVNGQVHIHKTALKPVEGGVTYTYYIGNNGADYSLISNVSDDEELKTFLTNADEAGSDPEDVLVKEIDDALPGGKTEAVNAIMGMVEITTVADPTLVSYTAGVDAPILKKAGADSTLYINVSDCLVGDEKLCATAPLYVIATEQDGSLKNTIITATSIDTTTNTINLDTNSGIGANETVFVDFYAVAEAGTTKEIQIDAEHFAGYFYVEADTLFRRQIDGKDCPAIITLPNVKIQSNFSFSLSSSGDPSELMRSAA